MQTNILKSWQIKRENDLNVTENSPNEENVYFIDDSSDETPTNESTTQGYLCKICTMKYESEIFLQAHLMESMACFGSQTKHYWSKPGATLQCTICCLKFQDEIALQRHCFGKMTCKLHYVERYLRDNNNQDSSMSAGPSADNTVSSASTSITNSVPGQVAVSSSTASQLATTSSASATTGETTSEKFKCSFCEKSFKKIRTLKGHITRMHTNNDQKTTSNVSENRPNLNAAQYSEGLQRSYNRFTCKKCKKSYVTANGLKTHINNKTACLEYYEHPRNKNPTSLRFCFKCKRGFKNMKECKEHRCIGLCKQSIECAICKQRFPTVRGLRKHELIEHSSALA